MFNFRQNRGSWCRSRCPLWLHSPGNHDRYSLPEVSTQASRTRMWRCLSSDLTYWGRDKMVGTLADDIFKCVFLNENVRILIRISLKFDSEVPIYNKPPSVQMVAWRLTGDKPLSEPMMAFLLTDIYVTLPWWVNCSQIKSKFLT